MPTRCLCCHFKSMESRRVKCCAKVYLDWSECLPARHGDKYASTMGEAQERHP